LAVSFQSVMTMAVMGMTGTSAYWRRNSDSQAQSERKNKLRLSVWPLLVLFGGITSPAITLGLGLTEDMCSEDWQTSYVFTPAIVPSAGGGIIAFFVILIAEGLLNARTSKSRTSGSRPTSARIVSTVRFLRMCLWLIFTIWTIVLTEYGINKGFTLENGATSYYVGSMTNEWTLGQIMSVIVMILPILDIGSEYYSGGKEAPPGDERLMSVERTGGQKTELRVDTRLGDIP